LLWVLTEESLLGPDDDAAALHGHDLDGGSRRDELAVGDDGEADAVILTKLDEASDHTCFGRLLTLQAKYGLPLAFITTGQKVPDDIVLPDAHAIASRILSAPLL